MFDLKGRCALITGASGGIGGSIARALYSQGAKVALSGTRLDPLKALADNLGDRAFIVPCNLSDIDAGEVITKNSF
jgi:3-oxoacyl-[acyl-carrier protein] reductase